MLMEAKLVGSLLIFWKEIYVSSSVGVALAFHAVPDWREAKKKEEDHHSIFFVIQEASSPGLQTQLYNELFILGKQKCFI